MEKNRKLPKINENGNSRPGEFLLKVSECRVPYELIGQTHPTFFIYSPNLISPNVYTRVCMCVEGEGRGGVKILSVSCTITRPVCGFQILS
jgi:hypothetical protein